MTKKKQLKLLEEKSDWKSGAIFSEDRQWRYSLWRIWDEGKSIVAFIGLNPSTADELKIVTRCIRFAQRWGYGGMYMLNLFGLRSTDSKALYGHKDPVGKDNDSTILTECGFASEIVLCWGDRGALNNQSAVLLHKLKTGGFECKLRAFGLTKAGYPRHLLYLTNDTQLVEFAC